MDKIKSAEDIKHRWIVFFWIVWLFTLLSTYFYNMITQVPGRLDKIVAEFKQIMGLLH